MTKLNLNRTPEEIAIEFSKLLGSNAFTKAIAFGETPEEDVLDYIILEVGGYYDYKTNTHLPKVEVKITAPKVK